MPALELYIYTSTFQILSSKLIERRTNLSKKPFIYLKLGFLARKVTPFPSESTEAPEVKHQNCYLRYQVFSATAQSRRRSPRHCYSSWPRIQDKSNVLKSLTFLPLNFAKSSQLTLPLPPLQSLAAPCAGQLRDIIEGAPSLRELFLFGSKPVVDAVNFSSRILTSLELGKHISTCTLFRLLPEFPALERLTCGVSHWHPVLMPATVLTHVCLQSSILGGYESTFVLNYARTPQPPYPRPDLVLSSNSGEGYPRYWPDRYFVVDPLVDTS
ncbi:hypothetical protein C8R47DRAFT_596512 [Mycena vitilis]|nr:hypothetical protein C8R47DRAFT_596512 [Mycena vitilis]